MKFVKASLLDNSPTLSVVGGSLIFVISSFSNVENFYIQLATDETIEKLNNFDFLMTTECIIDIISFDALRIGDLVVFADLQTWGQKRAAVTAICRLKCLCSIFLIDYGITVENVRPEKLKFYPGILMDAPMALKAAFCGLKSVVNSNGVISSFVENEILEGRYFNPYFGIRVKRECPYVNVLFFEAPCAKHLNTYVFADFVTFPGSFSLDGFISYPI